MPLEVKVGLENVKNTTRCVRGCRGGCFVFAFPGFSWIAKIKVFASGCCRDTWMLKKKTHVCVGGQGLERVFKRKVEKFFRIWTFYSKTISFHIK